MKIQSVTHNNRKRAFQVKMSKKVLDLPYSRVDPQPSHANPITRVFVDKELGGEGFTYVLSRARRERSMASKYWNTTRTRTTCGMHCCIS